MAKSERGLTFFVRPNAAPSRSSRPSNRSAGRRRISKVSHARERDDRTRKGVLTSETVVVKLGLHFALFRTREPSGSAEFRLEPSNLFVLVRLVPVPLPRRVGSRPTFLLGHEFLERRLWLCWLRWGGGGGGSGGRLARLVRSGALLGRRLSGIVLTRSRGSLARRSHRRLLVGAPLFRCGPRLVLRAVLLWSVPLCLAPVLPSEASLGGWLGVDVAELLELLTDRLWQSGGPLPRCVVVRSPLLWRHACLLRVSTRV